MTEVSPYLAHPVFGYLIACAKVRPNTLVGLPRKEKRKVGEKQKERQKY